MSPCPADGDPRATAAAEVPPGVAVVVPRAAPGLTVTVAAGFGTPVVVGVAGEPRCATIGLAVGDGVGAACAAPGTLLINSNNSPTAARIDRRIPPA